MLPKEDGHFLVRLARETIEDVANKHPPRKVITYPKSLNEKLGLFCTLTKNGELRGCIGFPEATFPLIQAVVESAKAAAFSDPRFMPVTAKELSDIEIEISVLTKPTATALDDIREKEDGAIIEKSSRSALFLPQVWDELPTKDSFFSALCVKAGLRPDDWKSPGMTFYKFNVQAFEEKDFDEDKKTRTFE
ncbi:MAG: AmmeMemoRadiSam system protein A [Candidatus Aenigmatarchaeota archaeon]